jgi:hypothetical protein
LLISFFNISSSASIAFSFLPLCALKAESTQADATYDLSIPFKACSITEVPSSDKAVSEIVLAVSFNFSYKWLPVVVGGATSDSFITVFRGSESSNNSLLLLLLMVLYMLV